MMYNRNNIDKNGETGDMAIKSRYHERDKLDLQEEPEVKVAASEQITTAIAANVHSGSFLPAAGSIPYGYIRDARNGTYQIDDETFLVIRKIFTMRAGNESISAITAYLNGQGIPSPGKLRYIRGMTTDSRMKETQWTRATVRKILNDISYVGHRVHGRKKLDSMGQSKKLTASDEWTVIENAHPAIIPEELFNTVQAVNNGELDKYSKQERRSAVTKDYREVLRGKLFCADCGKAMIAKKSAAKPGSAAASFVYYECSSYYSDHRRCSHHYVREDAIVAELSAVLTERMEIVSDPLYRKTQIEPYKIELEKIQKVLLSIHKEKDAISERNMHFYEQYQERKISVDEFKQVASDNREQMYRLDMKERELTEKMSELNQRVNLVETWVKMVKEYGNTTSLSRDIKANLIDRITIHSGSKIRVKFHLDECLY